VASLQSKDWPKKFFIKMTNKIIQIQGRSFSFSSQNGDVPIPLEDHENIEISNIYTAGVGVEILIQNGINSFTVSCADFNKSPDLIRCAIVGILLSFDIVPTEVSYEIFGYGEKSDAVVKIKVENHGHLIGARESICPMRATSNASLAVVSEIFQSKQRSP
jgi:hypothetical protein